MKFILTATLLLTLTVSCRNSILGRPLTRFFVKNNSKMPIRFEATVLKHSPSGDLYVTVPFMVWQKDSVLARTTYFKKDGDNPQAWFIDFTIPPVGNIKINDPNVPYNWKKGLDENKRPYYTFVIAE